MRLWAKACSKWKNYFHANEPFMDYSSNNNPVIVRARVIISAAVHRPILMKRWQRNVPTKQKAATRTAEVIDLVGSQGHCSFTV